MKPYEGEGERITVAFNCWFSLEGRAGARLAACSPAARGGHLPRCAASHGSCPFRRPGLRTWAWVRHFSVGMLLPISWTRLQKTISPSLRSFTKSFVASSNFASSAAAVSCFGRYRPDGLFLAYRCRGRGRIIGRRRCAAGHDERAGHREPRRLRHGVYLPKAARHCAADRQLRAPQPAPCVHFEELRARLRYSSMFSTSLRSCASVMQFMVGIGGADDLFALAVHRLAVLLHGLVAARGFLESLLQCGGGVASVPAALRGCACRGRGLRGGLGGCCMRRRAARHMPRVRTAPIPMERDWSIFTIVILTTSFNARA